jgi:hypothetical protein
MRSKVVHTSTQQKKPQKHFLITEFFTCDHKLYTYKHNLIK